MGIRWGRPCDAVASQFVESPLGLPADVPSWTPEARPHRFEGELFMHLSLFRVALIRLAGSGATHG